MSFFFAARRRKRTDGMWYDKKVVRRKVLSAEQRFKINLEVGKHLMLLGNLAAGALIFGQIVSGAKFKPEAALAGIVVCGILYAAAVYLMKGGVK